MGHRFMGQELHKPIRAQYGSTVPDEMCDGEPNNETGLYIPYRARLAQTLRTPDAFPSLNKSRISSAVPIRNYILIMECRLANSPRR